MRAGSAKPRLSPVIRDLRARGPHANRRRLDCPRLSRGDPPSGRSSGVEHNLAKVGVEGSNPFARSSFSLKIKWLGYRVGRLPFSLQAIRVNTALKAVARLRLGPLPTLMTCMRPDERLVGKGCVGTCT